MLPEDCIDVDSENEDSLGEKMPNLNQEAIPSQNAKFRSYKSKTPIFYDDNSYVK